MARRLPTAWPRRLDIPCRMCGKMRNGLVVTQASQIPMIRNRPCQMCARHNRTPGRKGRVCYRCGDIRLGGYNRATTVLCPSCRRSDVEKRHQEVLDLWDQGLFISDIAEKTEYSRNRVLEITYEVRHGR